MTTRHPPSHAFAELAEQHAALRELIARCDDLADALDEGTVDPEVLLGEITRLRVAFDTHNQYEEHLLHPILLDTDWVGAVRVSRMVEDHVEEHRAMERSLHGAMPGSPPGAMLGLQRATQGPMYCEPCSSTTAALRDVLASLRAHLASEERTFLSQKVLRDDLSRS